MNKLPSSRLLILKGRRLKPCCLVRLLMLEKIEWNSWIPTKIPRVLSQPTPHPPTIALLKAIWRLLIIRFIQRFSYFMEDVADDPCCGCLDAARWLNGESTRVPGTTWTQWHRAAEIKGPQKQASRDAERWLTAEPHCCPVADEPVCWQGWMIRLLSALTK